MALNFVGATTDRVDIGSGASLQGLTTGTILGWINPAALATRFLFGTRYAASGTSAITLNTDASGNLRLNMAGTVAHVFTSNVPLTAAAWAYFAVTFTFGSSGHIYVGSLATIASETTYGTATNGSGQSAETGGSVLWGPRYVGSVVAAGAWNGRIALGQIYNRELSLGEIRSLQFNPRPLSGCKAYHRFGWNGTGTQPDLSGNGNAGTVTGATQAAHVPLGSVLSTAPRAPYTSFQTAWGRGANQFIGSGLYVA